MVAAAKPAALEACATSVDFAVSGDADKPASFRLVCVIIILHSANMMIPESRPGQAVSSEVVRDINRRLVLNLIRMRQPISRADLARVSGLQRSTISLDAACRL